MIAGDLLFDSLLSLPSYPLFWLLSIEIEKFNISMLLSNVIEQPIQGS